jgi:twitching motility protein PilT
VQLRVNKVDNVPKSAGISFEEFDGKVPDVNNLLKFCTDNGCSDLYIKVGQAPFVTRWGFIHTVPSYPVTSKIWNEWAKEAITSENNAKYVRQKMLDFSYTIALQHEGKADALSEELVEELRYRVSAGFSLGRNIATFRMITRSLPSFSSINFPENIQGILRQVMKKRQGITLFVGVTGSGKTTTLAACMNDFTKNGGPLENTTIISLEDPVEYVFPSTQNVNILQKELGTDFKNFADGVKQSLREHPNFANVGETRDKETIETLVEGSRTGHGVISSFHASDCADTISRMYNMLAGQNEGIMYDLVVNLNLILCQRLIPNVNGFQLDTQYMVFTDEIKAYLNKSIANGENIPMVINGLFQDEKLLSSGLLKDWSVK